MQIRMYMDGTEEHDPNITILEYNIEIVDELVYLGAWINPSQQRN